MEREKFQEILNQVAEIHERNKAMGGDDLSNWRVCEQMGLQPWKATLAQMATLMGALMNAAKSHNQNVESETVAEMLTELSEQAIIARMLLESPGAKSSESVQRRGHRPGQRERKDVTAEAGDTLPGNAANPTDQE